MSSDFRMSILNGMENVLRGIDSIHKTIQTTIRKYPLTTVITQLALAILALLTANVGLAFIWGMSYSFTLFNIRNMTNALDVYNSLGKNEWTASEAEREAVLNAVLTQEAGRAVFSALLNFLPS